MTTPPKITYYAETEINGEKITATRTSHRIYTHAAVRGPYSSGGYGVTFHGSAAQAARKNEYGPVAKVVEVTSDRNYNDAAKAAAKNTHTPPAVEPESQNSSETVDAEPVSETEVEEPRHAPITHVVSVDGVERVKATRGRPEANELFDILVRENPASVVIMTTAKGREVRRHDGPLSEQQPADATPSADEVAEATTAVITALHQLSGRDVWTELWESLPSGSVAEFRTAAIRLLGQKSDLRSITLNAADWQEVYGHFHPSAAEESHNGSETVEETSSTVVFASTADLGDSMQQVVLALAALAEQGHGVRIESGLLAGHEEALLAAAPVLAALHRAQVGERVSTGLTAAAEAGRKGGRPKAVDEETRAALVARVEAGESVTQAAAALGVKRATAYRLLPKAK